MIALTAGLPDKFMISYMEVMNWFLSTLAVCGNKLDNNFEFHMDYELGMRNGTELMARLHGYNPSNRQERFHLLQMIVKHIGSNHLRGAYMYTAKGDASFFNKFRYNFQLLYVSNMLPLTGHRKMWDYLPKLIDDALSEMPKMKTPQDVLLSGMRAFWKWFEKTISGTAISRYSLKQLNGYKQAVRTSNKMESMHNKLRKAVGVHSNLYAFSGGMQQLENQTICDFVMRREQAEELKLDKQRQKIEDLTREVWDAIEVEITRLNNDDNRVSNRFWLDRCIELQNIHYGGKNAVSSITKQVFDDFDKGLLDADTINASDF